MKTLLALLLTISLASAVMVQLAWDANPEPHLDGYAVWVTPIGGTPDWQISAAGDATTINLAGLAPGAYSIYLTAFRDGLHSDPSNVLEIVIGEELAPPAGLRSRTVSLQSSVDLETWTEVARYEVADNSRNFYRIEFATP